MNAIHVNQPGPLVWVKPEIDFALERASTSLEEYFRCRNRNSAALSAAVTSLREVTGALQIIGMEALARFSREIEEVLTSLSSHPVDSGSSKKDLLVRATTTLAQYLADLVAGEHERAMTLLPLMTELARARGADSIDERCLFSPDLSVYPPPHPSGEALDGQRLESLVRLQRSTFQRGMLEWFRKSENGLELMRDALEQIESAQPHPQERAPWWIAVAFVEGLIHRGMPTTDEIKRLAARVERYLADFASGARGSENLVRDLLFQLARCEPASPLIREVKSLYCLDRYTPLNAATQDETSVSATEAAIRQAQNILASAKREWAGFSSGENATLLGFRKHVDELEKVGSTLNNNSIGDIVGLLHCAAVEARSDDPTRKAFITSEVAAALMATEQALDVFALPTPRTVANLARVRDRLDRALVDPRTLIPSAGTISPHSPVTWTEDQDAVAHVSREMLANLLQVEQALDAHFRGHVDASEISPLASLMQNVAGALSVLGKESAAQVMSGCNSLITDLSRATEDESELLVDGLSSVMLYVQTMEHSNSEELRVVESVLARFRDRETSRPETSGAQIIAHATDRTQLEDERTNDGRSDNGEHPSRPVSRGVPDSEEVTKEELADILDQFDLTALQDDVAKPAYPENDSTAAQHVPYDEPAHPQPGFAEASGCSQHVDEITSGLDSEILDIFLEEADELLASVADHIVRLRTSPQDRESLSALRRGFHTLKGSGRMARLTAIGDAAWTVESLTNLWLETERSASADLIAFLDFARQLFAGYISDVAQHGYVTVRTDELEGYARRLADELTTPPEDAPSSVALIATERNDEEPPTQQSKEPISTAYTENSIEIDSLELPASLFQVFLNEANETFATLQAGLTTPGLQTDERVIEVPRRAAHTLSGIARAAGFSDVGFVASTIEDLLDKAIDRSNAVEVFGFALEILGGLIASVATRTMPVLSDSQRTELLEKVAALYQHSPRASSRNLWTAHDLVACEDRADTDTTSTTSPDPILQTAEEGASPAAQVSAAPGESQHNPERRVVRDDIDEQLLPIFLDEVRDLIPLIGDDLRHLRSMSNDAAACASLRRVLHTIKGAARMVGAMRLGELVHVMEGRIETATETEAVSAQTLDELEAEFDRLTTGLDGLEQNVTGSETLLTSDGPAATTGTDTSETTEEKPLVEERPSLAAQIRVAPDALDRLLNQVGEMGVARGRIDLEVQSLKQFLLELTDSISRLRGQLREIEIHAESRLQATLQQTTDHEPAFDPLEFDRFTRFQELTRLMVESLHDVTTVQTNLNDGLDEVRAALSDQARMYHELQGGLMRLRTVSFNNIGERLHRVVRQATRETGKKALFEVIGGQTEVDRGVLERIAAPLEHLARNAVVHGIETPDQRGHNDKAEFGSITLTLRQEGSDLLISLSDDGQGIQHDRIREKAIELGWIQSYEQPTDSELEEMMLRAGFSTALEVTELAGRGVGMDVVANEVRSLGGRLEITTNAGLGTMFRIRVPVTVAVANALVVSAAGRRWAILSSLVEHVQEVSPNSLAELGTRRELRWMERPYPLFYLPQLFGENTMPPADRTRYFALLMRSGDQRVAVIVDQLSVNQDVVLKKLGPQINRVRGISGATILPSGEIVLILNPPHLADGARTSDDNPIALYEPSVAASPLVMVVDDSLTVRKVTTRLLTRNEFRVSTARDGLDALQQIQDTVPDILLVDIEMPRMDGFDLTKALKASPRTAGIPIIMITSRLAPKHREYAKKLGVDVYLGKPYEETELLANIEKFTAAPKAA